MTLIEEKIHQGILTLTLNRPDKLNALNGELLGQLSEILTNAKINPDVKALILTGAGKAFCAGADIHRLVECDAQSGYEFACYGQTVFRQLETLGKPSLAAINGYAFGGGCELAMAATLRLAVTHAQLGQPEIKLGIIPGYGGTQRLARLVGKGRALDLCLTGRTIDAQTACDWGLITEVVAPSALIERAVQIMQGLLAFSPIALSSIMEVIDHGYDMSLPDAQHLEAVHFAKICATHDKTEGIDAFLGKRAPLFKGC
jgi:enoyl-CoA hydratase